jgi:NADP-dependent 3-hydroxy acid dehydrogenase YdfG
VVPEDPPVVPRGVTAAGTAQHPDFRSSVRPETPFFDQATPGASRTRTAPDRLEGTVALVTGASSGIGAATAIALAGEGAAVAVAARRKDRLEEVAEGLREQGWTVLIPESDITEERQATAAVERTVAELGRLDTLVNNAGVMLLGPAVGAPVPEWQRMVDLNVMGLLYCAHAALPHLLRAAEDGPRRVADMVNISSTAGRIARNGSAVYTLTKHGIGAFSEALRLEPSGTSVCRWSSPARPRPSWPATTGPKCSKPCGARSAA